MFTRAVVALALVGTALSATQTTTLFDVHEKLSPLESQIDSIAEVQKSLPGAIAALGQAVGSVAPSIQRVDSLVDAVSKFEEKLVVLKKEVDGVPAVIDGKIGPVLKDIGDKLDAAKAAAGKAGDKAAADAAAALGEVEKSVKTETDKIGKDIAEAKKAAEAGTGKSVYVNWGNTKCQNEKKGVKTLYRGWTYGSYHDRRGGVTQQCIKNAGGSNGGVNTGNDSLDWMYPIRTDNCGGTPGVENRCGHNIACALCQYAKHCYMESTVDKCSADGYEAIYTGWLFGSYHGHNSQMTRICIDKEGDWPRNENHGAYMYPSLNNPGLGKRPGDHTLRCHVCCQK